MSTAARLQSPLGVLHQFHRHVGVWRFIYVNLLNLSNLDHIERALVILLHASYLKARLHYSGNTLRLWFPQMATIVEDYNSKNEEATRMCSIIDSHIYNKTFNVDPYVEDCVKVCSFETFADFKICINIFGYSWRLEPRRTLTV